MKEFEKKGKMFWGYQRPDPQQIISDGKKLWFYEPEEKQVTVAKVNDGLQSQISADLLNGKAQLTKDFKVKEINAVEPPGADKIVLELIPRVPQSTLSKVILKVNKENYQIYQTEVYDIFNNLTRITFSKIRLNTNLSDSLFTFTPPSGVEILTPPSLSFPQQ